MTTSSRLHRMLPAIVAAASLGIGVDACQAGKLFPWWGHKDECCPGTASCGPNCGCGQNDCDEDDDHDCCWKPRPAPMGAVVSAVPAVMVAQPAVAINTQAFELQPAIKSCQSAAKAARREDVTQAAMKMLLEELQASQAASAAAAAPAAGQPLLNDAAELEALEAQLSALRQMVDQLNKILPESNLE